MQVFKTGAGRMAASVLIAGVMALSPLMAAHKRKAQPSAAKAGAFDYYLLTLSYAPDFCAQPSGNKDPRECGAGRHIGFVVHGLWPQAENGRGPEYCSNASPVAADVVRLTLNYIPTESLIQHEWSTHGVCTGMKAADYFALLRKARDSVKIPDDLKEPGTKLELSPAQIEAKFAEANPAFPKDAFRATCYKDGELQEIRICLNKDTSPRACGASAGVCRVRTTVINPVR